jgi:hypothetical protein
MSKHNLTGIFHPESVRHGEARLPGNVVYSSHSNTAGRQPFPSSKPCKCPPSPRTANNDLFCPVTLRVSDTGTPVSYRPFSTTTVSEPSVPDPWPMSGVSRPLLPRPTRAKKLRSSVLTIATDHLCLYTARKMPSACLTCRDRCLHKPS